MAQLDDDLDHLHRPPGPEAFADLMERVSGRIVTGLVIGAALIGLAIYSRPGPPRFQVVASPAGVVRLDTRTGTMIACADAGCTTLHRAGERIARRPAVPATAPALTSPPAAPALPALPAPKAAPATPSR